MDQQHNYPTIEQFMVIEQKTEAIKTKAKAKLRLFINSLSDKSLGDCLNELIRVKRPDLLKSDNKRYQPAAMLIKPLYDSSIDFSFFPSILI